MAGCLEALPEGFGILEKIYENLKAPIEINTKVGEVTIKKGDTITVTLKNNRLNLANKNIGVYVAQYSENSLIDIKTAQNDEEFNASAQIDYSGGSIKLFIWEKETLTPVYSVIDLIE